jgi:hypothetical protein
MNVLKESGPVPGDENGAKKKTDEGKKRKRDKTVSPFMLHQSDTISC